MRDKTIRFTDSDSRELFCIPDESSIKIIYPPGDSRGIVSRSCQFINESHIRIGSEIYHMNHFAEQIEALGARFEPETQLRDVALTPFAPDERKYFTINREEGNSCIGHFSGDFGKKGNRYSSKWRDRDNDRNTSEFQTELHSTVYALRKDLLKDYHAMEAYCQSHPEAKLDSGDKFNMYGFKLETDTRQYFVKCFFGEVMRDARFIAYAYDKEGQVQAHEKKTSVLSALDDAKKSASPKNASSADKDRKNPIGSERG